MTMPDKTRTRRKWLKSAAKVLTWTVSAAALGLGIWALVPPGTRNIPGDHAVAEIRKIVLGGFPQSVLLRGSDRNNPVLLYVHGGPGSAQLPIARHYCDLLEKHFVVVHWDQRGAGASCADVDWDTLSLERIVADTIELAEKLGRGKKIFLIGHSWGSLAGIIAVQHRPDLFYAYMGTGQLVHRDRQEQASLDWVIRQARKAGDSKALAEVSRIHPPYSSQREFALQRRWLSKYNDEIFAVKSARRFIPAMVFGREYTLATRLRYSRCFRESLERLLADRLNIDLFSSVPGLRVPVFFFTGRRDYNTHCALVEEYASRLKAPHVEMVWFENAGHFLAIEAPAEFQSRLLEKLTPLAVRK